VKTLKVATRIAVNKLSVALVEMAFASFHRVKRVQAAHQIALAQSADIAATLYAT
jgi:hypothetical protein